MNTLTGPFTSGGTYVVDATGEVVCSTASDSDAVRIAADLNLADSVIAALSARPAGKRVVRFDLDRIAPEDQIDHVTHIFGESIERMRGGK